MFTAESLPPAPDGPACWMGSELSAEPKVWTRSWTDEQIQALIRAADGADIGDLGDLASRFRSSPALVEAAHEIRSELISGRGFTLVTGLPTEWLGTVRAAVAFMGFGLVVGQPRSQNAAGHLLGHVTDVGADPLHTDTRIYQTNARQTFHTDSADAVALLCLRPAPEGGRSLLASVETVYLRMCEERPDLAARLFDPVATDRRGEQPDGEDPWFEIPVLSWFAGRLTGQYQRNYIDSATRFDDAPKLDDEQIEALDLFDEIVNRSDVHLEMEFGPGDIQFVYNHALLHDRTAFVDHPEPDRRRHLLRLWLSLPGDRRLPPVFAQRYGSLTVGDRGGIVVDGTELCVPIDA